jgi:endonuclease-3 related protein
LIARLMRLLIPRQRRPGWWRADGPFEVCVGAILVQHATWAATERAIARLRAAGLLDPAALDALGSEALADLIRPAGLPRVKTLRLKELSRRLCTDFGGDVARALSRRDDEARGWLLSVPGIGPETADVILLYAAHRPVVVADAYARRILVRHGLLRHGASYDEAQQVLSAHLPSDPELLGEWHARVVDLCRAHCRIQPRCAGCPLAWHLRPGHPGPEPPVAAPDRPPRGA